MGWHSLGCCVLVCFLPWSLRLYRSDGWMLVGAWTAMTVHWLNFIPNKTWSIFSTAKVSCFCRWFRLFASKHLTNRLISREQITFACFPSIDRFNRTRKWHFNGVVKWKVFRKRKANVVKRFETTGKSEQLPRTSWNRQHFGTTPGSCTRRICQPSSAAAAFCDENLPNRHRNEWYYSVSTS